MAIAYPVTFEMAPPQRFQKPHVAIRVLVFIIMAFIDLPLIPLSLAVPVLSAIFISQRGPATFLQEIGPTYVKWGRYLVAAHAYLLQATDRLPNENPEETFTLQVEPRGSPTVGSALLRIITVIPHGIVLGIISIAYLVLWPVGAIYILAQETYPEWIFDFTRGWLRWSSRVLAYFASLVDDYPPFSFS